MGLDVAFSLVTLNHHKRDLAGHQSPQRFVSQLLTVLTDQAWHQLFLFFATSRAIACAIRDTEWIDRQKDALDELDVIAVFIFAWKACRAM